MKPHTHPCRRCGERFECSGTWKQNYDGFPEVICEDFHEREYSLCGACEKDDARPDLTEDDGA